MPIHRMHADEADIDVTLVTRLIGSQFPRWNDLTVTEFPSTGTDNAIFRLGDDMAVRLPLVENAAGQVVKEHEWLPRLRPHLPVPIPEPLVVGVPGLEYPWEWSVYAWLEGNSASQQGFTNPRQAAIDLGQFVAAFQGIALPGGPEPGPTNSFRGASLSLRDASVRAAIANLQDDVDTKSALVVWEAALNTPPWNGVDIWLHGDIQASNLLVNHGLISAAIDFGCLGVGDPACDVMAAWTCCSADTREHFRAQLSIDDATWVRGRGWALSMGLIALPYYRDTNPAFATEAKRIVSAALMD